MLLIAFFEMAQGTFTYTYASLLNTNVDGKRKIQYALTEIKGVGRRYSNIVCKKADIDLRKRYVCQSIRRYASVTQFYCHTTHCRNLVEEFVLTH